MQEPEADGAVGASAVEPPRRVWQGSMRRAEDAHIVGGRDAWSLDGACKPWKVCPQLPAVERNAFDGWPGMVTLGLRDAGTAQRNGFTAARPMTTRPGLRVRTIKSIRMDRISSVR
jgi:hypothetical protein